MPAEGACLREAATRCLRRPDAERTERGRCPVDIDASAVRPGRRTGSAARLLPSRTPESSARSTSPGGAQRRPDRCRRRRRGRSARRARGSGQRGPSSVLRACRPSSRSGSARRRITSTPAKPRRLRTPEELRVVCARQHVGHHAGEARHSVTGVPSRSAERHAASVSSSDSRLWRAEL